MRSKRMKKLQSLVDKTKVYAIEEAIDLIKKIAPKKFDETVEVHARLGIDAKKGDQQVRSTAVLPNSFGKLKKIAAFVGEDKAKEAKEAGADIVITPSEIPALLSSGKIDFDIAIAMPDVMKSLAPMAKILGPKGLMPSPKNETITTNLKKTMDELRKGKIAFKNDDSANVHQAIGKTSMDTDKLVANFEAFMEALGKTKPDSSKGVFIKNLSICSTMSPGLKIAHK